MLHGRAPKKATEAVPTTRKRRQTDDYPDSTADQTAAAIDSLGLENGAALEFGSDDDAGVDEDAAFDSDEDDGAEEPFPELDVQDSDGDAAEEDYDDDDGDDDSFDGIAEDEDEEDLDEDEAALLAEIEAEDAERAASSDEDGPSDLDELIRRNTVKPNENDVTPGTSWEDSDLPQDYMKRSRVVRSDITGQDKTQWDQEIDAGYGSDSSTEEVRSRVARLRLATSLC